MFQHQPVARQQGCWHHQIAERSWWASLLVRIRHSHPPNSVYSKILRICWAVEKTRQKIRRIVTIKIRIRGSQKWNSEANKCVIAAIGHRSAMDFNTSWRVRIHNRSRLAQDSVTSTIPLSISRFKALASTKLHSCICLASYRCQIASSQGT